MLQEDYEGSVKLPKPNFFILGAPKCGTTSLAAWLSDHPHVFISDPKEPNYFNTDREYIFKLSHAEYVNLFNGVKQQHRVVGEASTPYLSSRSALPAILDYADAPRFVVCIRNPVEMAVSLHGQLYRMGFENRARFADSWRLQDARKRGKKIPRLCMDPALLNYKDVCALGRQLRYVFERVPREQVCVVVLDDMRQDPAGQYSRVLNFLGLSDDGRTAFPVHNPATRMPRTLSVAINIASRLKHSLGIRRRFGLIRPFEERLRRTTPNRGISSELLTALRNHFKSEIDMLGTLLNRDFSPWLQGRTVPANDAEPSRTNGLVPVLEE